ncbi:MAG: hypothetical protein MUC35_03805 [Candidatus Margulisbacteria bacterium]|jgi:hypothetical protein|nr:hypothetical protein [Candidatus Margulisiibacteriota bacterium]
MNVYLCQDLFYILIGFLLTGLILGYSLFKRPCARLVFLTVILSLAGITDIFQVYGADPVLILLADSGNVLCALFSLTLFLQLSLLCRPNRPVVWSALANALFFLPGTILALLYTFTPLLIGGVSYGALGFSLTYQPAFWALVVILIGGFLVVCGLALREIVRSPHIKCRERATTLLFALLLAAYFYGTVVILPFLYETSKFASPLPLVCAALVLVYVNIKYGYFSD